MKNKYLQNDKLSIAFFLILMLTYAVTYMTKNCYSAAMVLLVDDGILTKSQTGTISASFYLFYAVFQVVGGFAADKFCPHKLITIGLVGAAIANAIVSVTDNYYVMLIVWSLNAIGQFGLWPAVFKLASTALAPTHRKMAIFYITFSGSIGTVISYIVAAFTGNWRSNFVVSTISLALIIAVWLISGRIFKKNMIENVPMDDGIVHNSHKSDEYSMKNIIITSGLILLLPVVVLRTMFDLGVQSITPTMIFESYPNVSSSLASILNLIPIIIGVAGKFLMKYIYRGKDRNDAAMMAIMFTILLPFLCMMLLVGKIHVIFIVAFISIITMIASMMSLVNTAYMPSRFTSTGRVATVSGLINAMASLGIVLSNFIFPRIADHMGWHAVTVSWIFFAGAALLISITAIVPWKRFVAKLK